MTHKSDILAKVGYTCPHDNTRWHRDGGCVQRICLACKTVLESDTVAFHCRPALANQLDPDEERAWSDESG